MSARYLGGSINSVFFRFFLFFSWRLSNTSSTCMYVSQMAWQDRLGLVSSGMPDPKKTRARMAMSFA